MDAVEGTEEVVLSAPFDVVCDVEVEVPIFVVIEPGAACAEAGVMDTGWLCDVNESTIAAVLEESVRFKATDIDVWVAVVVVIGDSGTHPVKWDSEPRGFSDIGEGVVSVVAIECHRLPFLGRIAFPILSVDEEDVLPSVGVVVDKGASCPHCFWEVFLSEGAGVMDKVDACCRSDVSEFHTKGRQILCCTV